MSPVNYAEFQLKDFLEDDFFVQWVINPNVNTDSFWQSFIENNPHKGETVEQAAEMIKIYRRQAFLGNGQNKDLVWQRISESVSHVEERKVFRMPVFIRVAAAILIVAAAALWLVNYYKADKTVTIATAAGEIKTITLPDHSKVTLNGNTTLSYSSSWDNEMLREVWISGEGYFDIKHLNKDTLHINPSDRFIVHCDDVNIEVLGTTFNVKARSGKTNVALLTGKIRIDYVNKTNNSLVMAPGDYVEYAGKELLVNKKLAKPAQVTAWTNANEISFTDATLREITETLENRFGYTVNAQDTALYSLKIEGDITVSNVADLLDVVATTLDVAIEQTANKHITISK
ncbi:FecR family protein [Terrimonas alba]|uniref:FecR family protein n=1 Tax=Terrimonas alba TaxID=3349636 RepID=UPI0035F348EB